MAENTNMSAVIDEVRNADEESLKKVAEDWFEETRTAGMRIGAQYISAAVYGAIEKNIKTGSLRDHQRAIKAVLEIVSVQLNQQKTQQNDLDLPEDEEV
jgi:hypothetical protein